VAVASLTHPGDGLQVEYVPELAISEAITVEAWVRPRGIPRALDVAPVVSMYGANRGWELRCGSGACAFVVIIDNATYAVSASGLVPGAWYHIAGVYDGQALYIYLNGVLKSGRPLKGSITLYPFGLGIGLNTYWPDRIFTGELAEIRLWRRPRDQREIQRDLFIRLIGHEDDLVAVWHLENNGISPTGIHALSTSGTAWARSSVPLPDTASADGRFTAIQHLEGLLVGPRPLLGQSHQAGVELLNDLGHGAVAGEWPALRGGDGFQLAMDGSGAERGAWRASPSMRIWRSGCTRRWVPRSVRGWWTRPARPC
jgi:hypothetical protein